LFFQLKISTPFGIQFAIFIVGAVSGGGGGGFEWTVSLRINSTGKKLPFDMSIPIILYLIVSSSW
jgi:hypothetical protein